MPDGYTREGEQIGTGPFKLTSFTPGTESVHERHPNYWKEGKPYLDGVQIIDYADATALVNALLAGQVDCIADVPFAQVSTIESNGGFTILESQAGSFLPITMAVDQAPFDDVRVRQAFRLIVDRDEMVAACPVGLRPGRQRPVLAVRRLLRERPAAAGAGHRAGEGAARGSRPGRD